MYALKESAGIASFLPTKQKQAKSPTAAGEFNQNPELNPLNIL